jgi:hypothetical protein
VINGECQVACRLGGVSVLVTGPKGHGFNPSRGYGFLRAIKIRSTPSFGWEVKLEAPCRILRRLKRSLHLSQILICKILTSSSIPPTHSQLSLLVGLPDSFVNESGVFPSRRHHHHGAPSSRITRGMVAAVLTRLTPSTGSIGQSGRLDTWYAWAAAANCTLFCEISVILPCETGMFRE